MKKINPKQEKFCQNYVTTGNATQSYIDAGYSSNPETAQTNAARMLGNARVSERLKELQAECRERCRLSRSEIISFLSDVILTPVTELDETSPLVHEVRESRYGKSIKMVSKMDAIKELNRMMGNYGPEKVEVGVEKDLRNMMLRLTGQANKVS